MQLTIVLPLVKKKNKSLKVKMASQKAIPPSGSVYGKEKKKVEMFDTICISLKDLMLTLDEFESQTLSRGHGQWLHMMALSVKWSDASNSKNMESEVIDSIR